MGGECVRSVLWDSEVRGSSRWIALGGRCCDGGRWCGGCGAGGDVIDDGGDVDWLGRLRWEIIL